MIADAIRNSQHPSELLSVISTTERVVYHEYAHAERLWTPARIEWLRKVASDFDALFRDLDAAAGQEEIEAAMRRGLSLVG